jgi:hypothetical protein
MANPSAVYKQNDRLPLFDCTLKDANGPRDITGDTVRFVMRSSEDEVIIDETSTGSLVTVLDSTAGRVRYSWAVGDLASVGNYLGEWETTDPLDRRLTFPNSGNIDITVYPERST